MGRWPGQVGGEGRGIYGKEDSKNVYLLSETYNLVRKKIYKENNGKTIKVLLSAELYYAV